LPKQKKAAPNKQMQTSDGNEVKTTPENHSTSFYRLIVFGEVC
jgi:hypothetical protein